MACGTEEKGEDRETSFVKRRQFIRPRAPVPLRWPKSNPAVLRGEQEAAASDLGGESANQPSEGNGGREGEYCRRVDVVKSHQPKHNLDNRPDRDIGSLIYSNTSFISISADAEQRTDGRRSAAAFLVAFSTSSSVKRRQKAAPSP